TLGCYPLTGAVESEADTIEKIVEEMMTVTVSERTTRVIDFDQDASMEQKKREGYFYEVVCFALSWLSEEVVRFALSKLSWLSCSFLTTRQLDNNDNNDNSTTTTTMIT
nr:hypothetical protein [Spirochaetales bacterium]